MQFRRSGQRDDRRRRLFNEESGGTIRTSRPRRVARPSSLSTAGTSENYRDTAFMDEQPRLIDLVPRRLTTFALWLLAGLGVVIGLEVLYAWSASPALQAMTTDGRIAAFDLDGEGSLAVWFSSATLGLAALVAVLVYTIRRHKTDDYQGYYRVWLWAAMCWLVMSIDETSSLHEGFKEMMANVTGTRLLGDGSIWWITPYFFLLGAVGSRLLMDMRHCRLSSAALVTAGVCCALAVIAQLGWILPTAEAKAVMLEEGAEMVGNLFLLLAMGLHARYVLLDVEGLLPRREPKCEDELEEEDEESSSIDEEWLKVEAAHQIPAPKLKRKAAKKHKPLPEIPTVRRKLSKGERKALRKRLMQERMQRES